MCFVNGKSPATHTKVQTAQRKLGFLFVLDKCELISYLYITLYMRRVNWRSFTGTCSRQETSRFHIVSSSLLSGCKAESPRN